MFSACEVFHILCMHIMATPPARVTNGILPFMLVQILENLERLPVYLKGRFSAIIALSFRHKGKILYQSDSLFVYLMGRFYVENFLGLTHSPDVVHNNII